MNEENMISKGRHRALVRAAEDGIQVVPEDGQKAGYVAVCFDLSDPNDGYYGWSITAFLYLTDKTIDRTVESLRHMGWGSDDLADLPGLAAAGQLATEVELVIDHEEWEGKWRAKVKWVNRVGGGTVKLEKALKGNDLTAFSAQMKSRIRAASAGKPSGGSRSSGGGSGGQAPHPNAPDGLDDIPF
jgi:hypothetical protein